MTFGVRSRTWRAFAIGLAALGVLGCSEPTAILVFVDSDMNLSRIDVEVTGASGAVVRTTTTDFTGTPRPLRLTLVPSSEHPVGDFIEIELKGYVGSETEAAIERSAVATFTDGETRFIVMYLFDVCAGRSCPDMETCIASSVTDPGECESEDVAAQPYDGDPAPIASTPRDGGVPDAGVTSCDASCWHLCEATGAPCETPVELALGGAHSCALTRAGNVYCWGDNDEGQLGHPGTVDRPTRVTALSGVTSLGAGQQHTCASDDAGRAWCWGSNMDAQLGRELIETRGTIEPVEPQGLAPGDTVERIGVGDYTNCMVVSAVTGPATQVRCFGLNAHGSAGRMGPPQIQTVADTAVADVNDAVSAHPGRDHSCAVVDEGGTHEVVCWGWASLGRLGDGTITDRDELTGIPVESSPRPLLGNVIQLAVGEQSACALVDDDDDLEDGSRLRCWGPNEDRELGTGNGDTAAPYLWAERATSAPSTSGDVELMGWDFVAMGYRQGCGILGNAVYCWGWSNDGALGVPGAEHVIPTPVTDLDTHGVPGSVALGGGPVPRDATRTRSHACAILGGNVWCWGDNDRGQLGLGSGSAEVVIEPQRLGAQ